MHRERHLKEIKKSKPKGEVPDGWERVTMYFPLDQKDITFLRPINKE